MTTLQTEVRRYPAVVTATDEANATFHCSRSFLAKTQELLTGAEHALRSNTGKVTVDRPSTGKAGHPAAEGMYHNTGEATYPTVIFSSAPLPTKWNVARQETKGAAKGHISLS